MKLLGILLGLLAIIAVAGAVPTTGAASDITSNGWNMTITGVTGNDCWVMWGDFSGGENWATPNTTASGGTANIQVLGTPIFGGEKVWYQACDPERTRFLFNAAEEAALIGGAIKSVATCMTSGQVPAVTITGEEQPEPVVIHHDHQP